MMLEEFEQRTGFYPTLVQYAAIERAYTDCGGDKGTFCKAYKKNAGGIAERIQREVNMDILKQERDQAAELSRRDIEIERLKRELDGSRSGNPMRIPTTSPRRSTSAWPKASPAAQRTT